jgi:hypothetical protein
VHYAVTHHQCACDFFTVKNVKLREDFMKFISERMEIACVEPCIFIKWLEDTDTPKFLPDTMKAIPEHNLIDIFTTEYDEAYYRVERTGTLK